jgi:hypothetical protein
VNNIHGYRPLLSISNFELIVCFNADLEKFDGCKKNLALNLKAHSSEELAGAFGKLAFQPERLKKTEKLEKVKRLKSANQFRDSSEPFRGLPGLFLGIL